MSLSIEWYHDRRRIVLPVVILRPEPSADLSGFEGSALLDTGATTTGITPHVARTLGLVGRGKRLLGSARGEEQAERYLFRVGLHSDREAADPPCFPFIFDDIVGFELKDNFLLDALIGMDVLARCDFSMDRGARCRLEFG